MTFGSTYFISQSQAQKADDGVVFGLVSKLLICRLLLSFAHFEKNPEVLYPLVDPEV